MPECRSLCLRLMSQAMDGRIRGHIAVPGDAFAKVLIMKNAQGVRRIFP
jgi:hypothetical protein